MANPNPAHNPTDGLGSAVYVHVTGTNLTNRSGGGLTVASEATYAGTSAANGQGYGAIGNVTNRPNFQYALTLSLSSKLVAGVQYSNACTLTTTITDVAGTTYSQVGSPTYKTLCPQSAPLRPSSTNSPDIIATCSSNVVTAVAVGQVVLEVTFPTFDQVGGNVGYIRAHVLVTVTP
jgi:hypothetical protein